MDNFVGIPPPILLFPIKAFLVKNMWPVSDQFLRMGNILIPTSSMKLPNQIIWQPAACAS